MGDFIVQSIESSQKIIIVITKNFIEKDWWTFSFKAPQLEAIRNMNNRVIVVLCGDVTENDMDSDLQSIVKMSTKLRYEDKSFWSKLHASLPSDAQKISNYCHVSETNYVTRNSIPTFSPRQSLKQGVPLVPTMVLGQPLKTNNHYHNLHNNHRHLHQQQSSLDSNELDNTFISVETSESSLGSTLSPSSDHSYMSIDYAQAKNLHIYTSIDEPSTQHRMYHSAIPSVHTLHQHQHQHKIHHLPATTKFADPSLSASYL